MRNKIGPTKAQNGFPESVLAIIWDIATGDIEKLDRLEKMPIKSICKEVSAKP